MKKIVTICFLVVVAGIGLWYYFNKQPDYSKIVFVLPSSERTSSPYFYKKDGDFFLADDLRAGFEKLGYKVEYRFRQDYDDLKLGNAGNILYFKGYYNFDHLPEVKNDKRKRVLYLYYLEGLNPAILKEVDVVVTASNRVIEELVKPMGKNEVAFVPQFTNPNRFKKAEISSDKKYPLLFVGSNHTRRGRLSVNYAVEAGFDVAVFGKFWETFLNPRYLKGTYIQNDDLYQYYGSADIVLNDHREDMRYYGFVSNRIYDVTASGGFVLTDYLPEIEAAYGNSVATYKNYEEFKEKVAFYLAHPEIRQIMAEKARKITLENFTNELAAKKFDTIFKNIQK